MYAYMLRIFYGSFMNACQVVRLSPPPQYVFAKSWPKSSANKLCQNVPQVSAPTPPWGPEMDPLVGASL